MADVELRRAKLSDLELMLAWRSNPRIYEHFHQQDEPLEWENHVKWFVSRPPNRRDFLIEYQGRRVGVVSVASDGDTGVYIGEETLWGEGVATEALETVCERLDERQLHARIHRENDASRRLFEKCGFEHVSTDGEWLRFEQIDRQ